MSSSTSKTQIIIALIGLVGAVAAAVIGNWDNLYAPGASSSNQASETSIQDDTRESDSSKAKFDFQNYLCFKKFFSNVANKRIKTIESGTPLNALIGPSESKSAVVGLLFTKMNQPIGALKFQLFPSNNFFKISKVVDANCNKVTEFSTESGGDRYVLDSWDVLKLKLGGENYTLQLDYDAAAS